MKLTVSERYILLDILPKEGTYTTLKVVNKLREALSFSEEEIKFYSLSETPDGLGGATIKWNPTVDQYGEVAIGEKAEDIIVSTLKKLDKDGKLTNREFSLYEKFVPED